MKKVLVTGGAGLIGSALCRRLVAEGYSVTCIDNFITSNKNGISDLLKNTNFKLVKLDITKTLPSVLNADKFSEIYHLACPTGVPNLTVLAEEMLSTCSRGTKNILDLAKKHNAKLIFTSSSEVYGDPLVFPQTENYTGNVDPVGIRSPYEEGKRFSEALLISYVRKYNLDAKIIRIFNTYGKKSADDTRVISTFLKNAKQNKSLPVKGKGKQTRTFCYVDDLVAAILIVMAKGKKGEVYNAGSDQEISIYELARTVIRVTKSKSKITFVKRPEHDHNRRRPDLTKLKTLGWNSTYSLEDGLRKLM